MGSRVFFDVNPATLRLPIERIDGADPAKLQRRIARHGRSLAGMPPVLVYRGSDSELMLFDGVTPGNEGREVVSGFDDPRRIAGQPTSSVRAPSNGAGEITMNVTTHDELDDLMQSLAELRRALPSMRLGQLIANMATVARGAVPGAVWDVEDEELSAAIRWQLEQLVSRVAADDGPPCGLAH